jgi:hypothetical protein
MARVCNIGRLNQFVWAFGMAMALAAVLGTSEARAVVPSPTGFTLQMSPYARVLDAIGEDYFMDVLWEESCDNPHLRVRARNRSPEARSRAMAGC